MRMLILIRSCTSTTRKYEKHKAVGKEVRNPTV
jgi:hypothetical protein